LKPLKNHGDFLIRKEEELAIIIWLKIFINHYTRNTDGRGAFKSVIMRIGQIILRVIILLFWTFFTIINKYLSSVIVGELNFSSDVFKNNELPVVLSQDLQKRS